jgi:hypothetical protein
MVSFQKYVMIRMIIWSNTNPINELKYRKKQNFSICLGLIAYFQYIIIHNVLESYSN